MRTAGSELPPTCTSPTPGTWDSFWPTMELAMSYSSPCPSTGEVSDSTMIGAWAGLILL